MKEVVFSSHAPSAIGPYSQAVKAGDFVFFSGQIPLKPDGTVREGDIAVQTRQVLQNMEAMLHAADLDFSHVVKTTIYLADMADFAVVNEIYGENFGDNPPARATVQVAGLPKGVQIEIDAIVALNG